MLRTYSFSLLFIYLSHFGWIVWLVRKIVMVGDGKKQPATLGVFWWRITVAGE
jgi:hypothetical protein